MVGEFGGTISVIDIGGVSYKINYYNWDYMGTPGQDKGVLVCLHGVSRNARDFDYVASALSYYYRVVCIDFIGRGRSDWLIDGRYYDYDCYAQMVVKVLHSIDISNAVIVGTSMGGFTAMKVAASNPDYVKALVLNDVSPQIDKEVLKNTAFHLKPKYFACDSEVINYMRKFLSPLGLTEEEHWKHMSWHSVVLAPEGGYIYHYDPVIYERYQESLTEIPESGMNLWDVWDAIKCPVYIIRGMKSRYLTSSKLRSMLNTGKVLGVAEYEKAGHAPGLASSDEIDQLVHWLS